MLLPASTATSFPRCCSDPRPSGTAAYRRKNLRVKAFPALIRALFHAQNKVNGMGAQDALTFMALSQAKSAFLMIFSANMPSSMGLSPPIFSARSTS